MHCVPRKEDTKLMAVTSSSLNRFSKFIHSQTYQQICCKVIRPKGSTTLQTRCYTTLWNTCSTYCRAQELSETNCCARLNLPCNCLKSTHPVSEHYLIHWRKASHSVRTKQLSIRICRKKVSTKSPCARSLTFTWSLMASVGKLKSVYTSLIIV